MKRHPFDGAGLSSFLLAFAEECRSTDACGSGMHRGDTMEELGALTRASPVTRSTPLYLHIHLRGGGLEKGAPVAKAWVDPEN